MFPGWKRVADNALAVAPVLFGVTVLAGIAISLYHLLGTAHPTVTVPATTGTDAGALYLGQPLYQDPAAGYTGALYTPLFPAVTAVLDHVYFWDGWPILLTVLASLTLAGLAARLAYQPASDGRRLTLASAAQAAGIGALVWWLVSNIKDDFLYEARQDEFPWAPALLGLALVPRAMRGSVRVQALSIALLSAGIWSKQTTAVASLAAVVWIALAVALGAVPRARAAKFVGALLAVNLLVLGLLNLLTSGWEWYFTVQLPARHAQVHHGLFLSELGKDTVFAVVFAGGVWALVGARALGGGASARIRRNGLVSAVRSWAAGASTEALVATVFAVFVGLALITATYFRRKQGAEDNQYIGLVWGLGLLGAAGHRFAGRSNPTRRAAGMLIVSLFAAAFVAHTWVASRVPRLVPSVSKWPRVPPALIAYADTHLIYHPFFTELNIRSRRAVFPSLYNVMDLLAAGEQPKYLVRAFLDRRFDAVTPEPDFPLYADYSWAYGKWEQNYLWKIDRVIGARYVAAPGVPPGFLTRRPGPERAPWMRSCFGPFALGGVSFRIHAGGGFWCHRAASGPFLSLVDTPAPVSEVVTRAPIKSAHGTLTVALPRPGAHSDVGLVTGGSLAWNLAIRRSPQPGRARVEVTERGQRATRVLPLPGSAAPRAHPNVEVALDGSPGSGFDVGLGWPGRPKLRVRLRAASDDALLRLAATRGSGARYGFGAIRLR